jgi:hypothetical protein
MLSFKCAWADFEGFGTYCVENYTRADQVDAVGDNETGREKMEVVRDAIGLDRV